MPRRRASIRRRRSRSWASTRSVRWSCATRSTRLPGCGCRRLCCSTTPRPARSPTTSAPRWPTAAERGAERVLRPGRSRPAPGTRARARARSRTSPLRSSAWPAASRAGRTRRKPCGTWSPKRATRWGRSRRTGAGISTTSSTPTRTPPGRRTPGRVDSFTTRASSIRSSSGSVRGRPRPWTRSSVFFSKRRGRRFSGPGSIRSGCAAVTRVCSWGPLRRSTGRVCTRVTTGWAATC